MEKPSRYLKSTTTNFSIHKPCTKFCANMKILKFETKMPYLGIFELEF